MSVSSDQSKSYLQKILSILSNTIISDKQEGIAAGTVATSNQTSSVFDKPNYKWVAFQFNATSLNAADGVIKLQDSLDGTNWNDITGATITVATGTSTNMIRYTAFTGSFIKAVWTKNSVSAGTISGNFLFKK